MSNAPKHALGTSDATTVNMANRDPMDVPIETYTSLH